MDFGMAMDVIIMASGVYMIFWAIQMKTTGKIPETLVGKGFNLATAKDPKGFAKATFPYTFGSGVLLILFGLVGALNIFVAYPLANTTISVVVIIVILLYGKLLMKAQKQYLVGIETPKKKK